MGGIGLTEVLLIIVLAVVIFGGPAVIGFWLGYQAGKKNGGTEQGRDDAENSEIAEKANEDE